MPKSSSLTQDLPEPFLRQRRNLVLTSVVLILNSLFVKEITSLSMAAVQVKLWWSDALPFVLIAGLVFLAYFAWRAWQRIDFTLLTVYPEDQNAVLWGLVGAVCLSSKH